MVLKKAQGANMVLSVGDSVAVESRHPQTWRKRGKIHHRIRVRKVGARIVSLLEGCALVSCEGRLLRFVKSPTDGAYHHANAHLLPLEHTDV